MTSINSKRLLHGLEAESVLEFSDGYEMGYIKGAVDRRAGSLHELAPE